MCKFYAKITQNYQLKWNQHVLRMPENIIPCKALQYRPRGKRNVGRPHRHWKDQFMLFQNGNWTQNCEWKKKKLKYAVKRNLTPTPFNYQRSKINWTLEKIIHCSVVKMTSMTPKRQIYSIPKRVSPLIQIIQEFYLNLIASHRVFRSNFLHLSFHH